MDLTYDEMLEVNKVQLEIFKQFISVCQKLNLKYYMVHGSLLGTIKLNGFFPFDDDIDVAMPRKDYNTLIKRGQAMMPQNIFIQSYKSEIDYPLAFAKIRNTNTAFIQPTMSRLNINQGIYIDVFPIDYYPENKFLQKWYMIKERFYGIRISERLHYKDEQPIWKTIMRTASKIICPSWRKAVERRAELYSGSKKSNLVISVGGKTSERGIAKTLFGKGFYHSFEDVSVICPSKSKEYLIQIYGEYENYNPAKKYMNDDNTVTVSAEIISTKESYRNL